MCAQNVDRWVQPRLIMVATSLADRAGLMLHAIAQAGNSGARILLVHVIRPASLRRSFDPEPDSVITSSRVAAAWDVLNQTARMVEAHGIPCEPLALEGDPLQLVPKVAEARHADRVIVATRGTRGIQRVLARSVAEALIASVMVPVCVIGPHVVAGPFVHSRGGKVLLALSLSHREISHLRIAAELALGRDARLVLLHVLDSWGMDDAHRKSASASAEEALRQMILEAGLAARNPEVVVREGSPVHVLLADDLSSSQDLMVMGVPFQSRISHLLDAGIVHEVIAGTRCPVITLRVPESEKGIDNAVSIVYDSEGFQQSPSRT